MCELVPDVYIHQKISENSLVSELIYLCMRVYAVCVRTCCVCAGVRMCVCRYVSISNNRPFRMKAL